MSKSTVGLVMSVCVLAAIYVGDVDVQVNRRLTVSTAKCFGISGSCPPPCGCFSVLPLVGKRKVTSKTACEAKNPKPCKPKCKMVNGKKRCSVCPPMAGGSKYKWLKTS